MKDQNVESMKDRIRDLNKAYENRGEQIHESHEAIQAREQYISDITRQYEFQIHQYNDQLTQTKLQLKMCLDKDLEGRRAFNALKARLESQEADHRRDMLAVKAKEDDSSAQLKDAEEKIKADKIKEAKAQLS